MLERQDNARSRFSFGRPQRLSALWRRSTVEAMPTQAARNPEMDIDSPKTPRFTLNMPNISSTTLGLRHLASNESTAPGAPTPGPRSPILGPYSPMTNFDGIHAVYSPVTNAEFYRAPTTYSPATTHDFRDPPAGYTPAGHSAGFFPGSVLEDPVIAAPPPAVTVGRQQTSRSERVRRREAQQTPSQGEESAQDEERRRRRERRRNRKYKRHHRQHQQQQSPKRFLFCFPWVKSRRMRSQILTCFVSGLFLLLMLTVYLALALTKQINTRDFSIVLILIILITTIIFCHSLVRICLMMMRPSSDSSSSGSSNHMNHFLAPGGYAIPQRPIRVVLARDEEAAGLENNTTNLKPPAYGLWRESVRVDPNRIYWQRNEDAPAVQEEEDSLSSSASESSGNARTTVPRPPSYASDDGVSYVVEARPRSIAPTTNVPLPPHASGREADAWRGQPVAL